MLGGPQEQIWLHHRGSPRNAGLSKERIFVIDKHFASTLSGWRKENVNQASVANLILAAVFILWCRILTFKFTSFPECSILSRE